MRSWNVVQEQLSLDDCSGKYLAPPGNFTFHCTSSLPDFGKKLLRSNQV